MCHTIFLVTLQLLPRAAMRVLHGLAPGFDRHPQPSKLLSMLIHSRHDYDNETVQGIICWFVEILGLPFAPSGVRYGDSNRIWGHLSLYSVASHTIYGVSKCRRQINHI